MVHMLERNVTIDLLTQEILSQLNLSVTNVEFKGKSVFIPFITNVGDLVFYN